MEFSSRQVAKIGFSLPDVLSKKVDMTKVKLDVLRPWISAKITKLLCFEDDVIEEYVVNQLEEEKYPNPKKMQ